MKIKTNIQKKFPFQEIDKLACIPFSSGCVVDENLVFLFVLCYNGDDGGVSQV